MTPIRIFLPLAALVLTFNLSPAQASAGAGTTAVRKANATIAGLLQQKASPGSAAERKLAARVTTAVRDFLDVEELGKRALSKHWKGLKPEQRREFMGLLRQLIEANYIKGLRANLDYQVVYTGEKNNGDNLQVSTEVKTKRRGRPYTISIEYVLRKDGAKLRTFDVVTDGVGLVENYRAMFNKIIARDGFGGLLGRMKKKAAKLSN